MTISDNLVNQASLCVYLQKNNILSWFQPGPLVFAVARRVDAWLRTSGFQHTGNTGGEYMEAVRNCWALHGIVGSICILYTLVVNIVTAPLHFLISLILPVNCSCSNSWFLPFVPPILFSRERGERKLGVSKWCVIWNGFSGNTKLGNTLP